MSDAAREWRVISEERTESVRCDTCGGVHTFTIRWAPVVSEDFIRVALTALLEKSLAECPRDGDRNPMIVDAAAMGIAAIEDRRKE